MNAWKCEKTYHGWIVYEVDDAGEPVPGPVIADCGDNEAVARRITAVPDLLQACKLTAELCEAVGGVTGCWTVNARRRLAQGYAACAREAIAKAEGKGVGS